MGQLTKSFVGAKHGKIYNQLLRRMKSRFIDSIVSRGDLSSTNYVDRKISGNLLWVFYYEKFGLRAWEKVKRLIL